MGTDYTAAITVVLALVVGLSAMVTFVLRRPSDRDLSGKLSARGAVLSTEMQRTAGCASWAPRP